MKVIIKITIFIASLLQDTFISSKGTCHLLASYLSESVDTPSFNVDSVDFKVSSDSFRFIFITKAEGDSSLLCYAFLCKMSILFLSSHYTVISVDISRPPWVSRDVFFLIYLILPWYNQRTWKCQDGMWEFHTWTHSLIWLQGCK